LAVNCSRQPVAPTGSADGRVTGRIVDYATGAGVAGASVVFEDIANDGRYVEVTTAAQSDATGLYTLTAPAGYHYAFVDGEWIGYLHVAGLSDLGDFLVHGGNCVARYGMVVEAHTLRAIAGVTVTVSVGGVAFSSAVTGAYGWYRMDLGCNALIG